MAEIIPITELSDERLLPYTKLNEPQLRTYYEPSEGLFIAESLKVIHRAIAAGYCPVSLLYEDIFSEEEIGEILSLCPVAFLASHAALCRIIGYNLTGGILCLFQRKKLPDARTLCRDAHRIAVLERVMNPTNVGAIMRSAAAMNMDAVLLTKDSSDPLYRRAIRVSMGTCFQIPWTFLDAALSVRDFGFRTAAMALCEDTVSIEEESLKKEEKLAVILGSECDGLLPETIRGSDYTVKIPMRETVDSLNVAAAAAVAFWELRYR